jgi:hypothetical protein
MIRSHAIAVLCLLSTGCVPHGPADVSNAPPDAGSADRRSIESREHLQDLAPLPEGPLSGEDADHDHIRDDVQRYVDDTYRDRELLLLAVRQYARAEQHGVVFANDPDRAQDAGDEIAHAIECLYTATSADEADAIWREIEARTLDDDDRVSAYLALQDALAGGYYESAPDPEDACAFDRTGLRP